ncbi:MAG TPA: regulatory protein RecX [Candidatus Omnitrophota bacterium]|nr:regulatory protein RecX [Candidatus Omnitrophota bacterium]
MNPGQNREAWDYALKLLAIRKRTSRQLQRRLIDKGFETAAVAQIVKSLTEKKLLDDADYAQSFVQEKQAVRPLGKRRLAYELKAKGIPGSVIDSALEGVTEETERETARNLALARAAAFEDLSLEKKKKKIYDFLVRRGFAFDTAREIIEKLR